MSPDHECNALNGCVFFIMYLYEVIQCETLHIAFIFRAHLPANTKYASSIRCILNLAF